MLFSQRRDGISLGVAGWGLGCGASAVLLCGLVAAVVVFGGVPFSPGPLSAERQHNRPLAGWLSHADFETRCELCHAPFRGPEAARCLECHGEVGVQIAQRENWHGRQVDVQKCATCHPDHKGRMANLTPRALVDMPHNQFGFTLARHQRGFDGTPLTCRSCHTPANPGLAVSAAVVAACIDCHSTQNRQFVGAHQAEMGSECATCHDGTDRLSGFNHATVLPLEQKHAGLACRQCHVDQRYRGTPRECVGCHPEPAIHRWQFGMRCEACHTAAGWRPARLIKHRFPLQHGNQGKESACTVCHPSRYAEYSCANCHAHDPAKTAREHARANVRDWLKCAACHPTGKKTE